MADNETPVEIPPEHIDVPAPPPEEATPPEETTPPPGANPSGMTFAQFIADERIDQALAAHVRQFHQIAPDATRTAEEFRQLVDATLNARI
jgi:hypothetical protein